MFCHINIILGTESVFFLLSDPVVLLHKEGVIRFYISKFLQVRIRIRNTDYVIQRRLVPKKMYFTPTHAGAQITGHQVHCHCGDADPGT